MPAFHLAFPVRDLGSTRAFYGGLLGCAEGRSASDWVDFDFFGHQLSAHVMPQACRPSEAHDVDGDDVPVRHFGAVLEWTAWNALRDRLEAAGVAFRIQPRLRFRGEVGEQATMFLEDPSGNALEFKAFKDPGRLFAVDAAERTASGKERERLLESERAARSEAERANRLKDQFVATLSHELRTPLNAIMGWTQILRGDPEIDPKTRRAVDVIERNVRAQTRLIADLLDMSRILSGKLQIEVRPVNLVPLIEAAVRGVRADAEAKHILIRSELDVTADEASGDPERLNQILWNLLSNAIKFTREGGHVQVSLRRVGSKAEVHVSDDGIGIEPELLPHVFTLFRQAGAPATHNPGGLGLGLSIVRSLVEMHGGTIAAESGGAGKGASFVVTLPLRTSGAVRRADRSTPPDARPGGGIDVVLPNALEILVVEDEPDTRELLHRVLEERGAKVTAVATAAEAVRSFAERRPELLVSDIGMPEVDGFEFIAQIRAMESPSGDWTPAIALTAFAGGENRTRAIRAGYQMHLVKPVMPLDLISAVASFSDLVASRRKARSSPAHGKA